MRPSAGGATRAISVAREKIGYVFAADRGIVDHEDLMEVRPVGIEGFHTARCTPLVSGYPEKLIDAATGVKAGFPPGA